MTDAVQQFIADKGLRDNEYLGDGVYVGCDGYQFWLHTLQGNRIALEPDVLARLNEYAERFRRLVS
jgi:hypothetical protein